MDNAVTFASILVSMVAAVATVAAAWAAIRTLHLQTSPDVIAYVCRYKNAPSNLMMVIENIGSAPAYNVTAHIEGATPLINSSIVKEGIELLSKRGVAMLAPGQKRDLYLGEYRELDALWPNETKLVHVRYSTRRGGRSLQGAEYPIEVYSFSAHVDIKTSSSEDASRRRAWRSISSMGKDLHTIALNARQASRIEQPDS